MIHLLQVVSERFIIPVLRPDPNLYESWMLPVLLLVFTILAYVRVVYHKRLQRLYSSIVRIQILKQVMREELVFSHRASVLLFLNFVLVLGLLIYAVIKHFGLTFIAGEGFNRYLVIVLAIGAAYLLKLVVASALRMIFQDPGLLREYLYVVFLINKAAGILLLPFAVAVVYMNVGNLPFLFWGFLGLSSLFLVYRTIQGLIISAGYAVSWVYIILYLCTLEIMPFLVIVEAVRREIL